MSQKVKAAVTISSGHIEVQEFDLPNPEKGAVQSTRCRHMRHRQAQLSGRNRSVQGHGKRD